MPYVRRDAEGRITALFAGPVEDGLEAVDAGDAELKAFMDAQAPADEAQKSFIEADYKFIRVLEDLIDILVDRGYVMISDFPEAAQQKLMQRQGLRREYTYVQSLFGDPDSDGNDGGGFL